jgi:hypothetical protein
MGMTTFGRLEHLPVLSGSLSLTMPVNVIIVVEDGPGIDNNESFRALSRNYTRTNGDDAE